MRNVIVVLFDSLPPRYLKSWGGGIEFIPTGIKRHIFKRCYTAATVTLPSIGSIFTGCYPAKHGIISHWRRDLYKLNAELLVLAEVFEYFGYDTLLGVTHKFGVDVYERLGLAKGFNRYFNIGTNKRKPIMSNASAQVRRLIATKPFFVWLHEFYTHIPYGLPAEGGGWMRFRWMANMTLEEGCKDRIKDVAGKAVNDYVALAKEHDAILCFLSDHGDVFISDTEGGHAEFLEEDNARAVWAILNAGTDLVDDGLHSLVDFAPTLLTLLGLPAFECDGLNAYEAEHEEVCCINEQTANIHMMARISKAGFEYSEFKSEKRLRPEDSEKVLSRLKNLGYIT